MKTSDKVVKFILGIIVGLIMVILFKKMESFLYVWGIHNNLTIGIVGLVSYLSTYITRDLIREAF